MATVHNPNNWHWVEKNCVPWAKEYFDTNLKDLSIPSNNSSFTIKSINGVTGDCDVTQRKGKVKCLFEMKVDFIVSIVNGEETEEVTVILPEFEHDYDEDDFNFEIKTSKPHYKTIIKKEVLPVVVEKVFLKFQPDLISAHEVDMKHNTD